MTNTVDYLSLLTGAIVLIVMLPTRFGTLHDHLGKRNYSLLQTKGHLSSGTGPACNYLLSNQFSVIAS